MKKLTYRNVTLMSSRSADLTDPGPAPAPTAPFDLTLPLDPTSPIDELRELDVPRCHSGSSFRPGRQVRALLTICVLALLTSVCVDAEAQSGWNRTLESAAILPTGAADEYTVHVAWTISVEPSSVPLDLSTVFEVYANGTLLTSQVVPGTVDAGSQFCDAVPCNASCGTGYFDGVFQGALLCYLDGPPPSNDCDCGMRFAFELDDPCSFRPDDEIMVLLRPAPGALPDPDTSDDVRRFDFRGGTHFWNRSVDSMELIPVAGASNRYNVEVQGFVEWDGMDGVPYLPLSFEADLLRNGVVLATERVIQDAVPAASGSCFYLGCGSYCGVVNGLTRYCDPLHFNGCVCGGGWIVMYPDVEWFPGDEIVVILRPSPGTLPELPGFEEDDEVRPPDETSSASLDGDPVPARLQLTGPNPMTKGATARISLEIDRPTYVRLEILNAQGRSLRTLANAKYPSGRFDWDWDGRTGSGEQVANGVYFTTMWIDHLPQVEKLLVVQ